jgi:pimeloyl-ACP methyl ester carboxylesterase
VNTFDTLALSGRLAASLSDATDGELALCGHSYGGMVVTEAGADDRVTQLLRAVACKDEPSTYFVCTEDLAIPAEVQRMRAADGPRLVDFPAGHHAFRSQPEAFAERIAAEFRPSTGHGSGAAGR